MKLVSIDEVVAICPDGFRATKSTLYKWHSLGLYPGLFVKVPGRLMFDLDRWSQMVGEAKKRSVESTLE